MPCTTPSGEITEQAREVPAGAVALLVVGFPAPEIELDHLRHDLERVAERAAG